jgi:hypothetical protein
MGTEEIALDEITGVPILGRRKFGSKTPSAAKG